jgi:SPX domain protein involved in polyphosphate accumulation
MSKLSPVKLDQIIEAIEMGDDTSESFYDCETGEIVWVSSVTMDTAEQEAIYERLDEHGFFRLPTQYDRHDYRIMEDFVSSLPSGPQSHLSRVMHGRGAFRRFKDTVIDMGLDTDWYMWRDDSYRKMAVEWCEENEIEYME